MKITALFALLLCIQLSAVQADDGKLPLPPHDVITAENASKVISLMEFDYGFEANGVAFSPDSKTLVTGGSELPKLWDVQSGSMIATLQAPMDGRSSKVAFSSDGHLIAATGLDSTYIEGSEGDVPVLCIWDAVSKNLVAELKGRGGQEGIDIGKTVFSPEKQQLAISNPSGIWNVKQVIATGLDNRIDEAHSLTGYEHYEQGATISYAPDGKTLVTGSIEGTIRYWDVETRVEQKSFQIDNNKLFDIAFSPNGKLLATASSHIKHPRESEYPGELDNPVVKIWNVETDKVVIELSGHQDNIRGIAFSPDGKLLVSASDDGSTRIWEVSTGKQIASLQINDLIIWDVAVSPDGKLIATAGQDGTVRLWGVLTK